MFSGTNKETGVLLERKTQQPSGNSRTAVSSFWLQQWNHFRKLLLRSRLPIPELLPAVLSCAGMNVCEAMIIATPSQLTINCRNKDGEKSTHSKTQKLMKLTREFIFLLWLICLECCLLNVFLPWQFAFAWEIQSHPTPAPVQLFRLK